MDFDDETIENYGKIANEVATTLVSILLSIFLVLLFVGLGWYIVWKCFLSRFKFIRELIGQASETDIGGSQATTIETSSSHDGPTESGESNQAESKTTTTSSTINRSTRQRRVIRRD